MQTYLNLLRRILYEGAEKTDRTGTGVRSVFGYQMRFDLNHGFPLLTTKKLHFKSIVIELLWMLKGDSNIKYLNENGVHIWDEWADENGNLGPVYGQQWRSWRKYELIPNSIVWKENRPTMLPGFEKKEVDQISKVIESIKNNPDSRRHVVSAWNVAEIEKMRLAPCHVLFQFYCRPIGDVERAHYAVDSCRMHRNELMFDIVENPGRTLTKQLDENNIPKYRLDCQLYQRSADVFLGLPFNIASYSLLTMMITQVCDLIPGEFIWTGGDIHLYVNHTEQAKMQLDRTAKPLAVVTLNREVKNIFDFKFEDFTLKNYDPHPHISASVSV